MFYVVNVRLILEVELQLCTKRDQTHQKGSQLQKLCLDTCLSAYVPTLLAWLNMRTYSSWGPLVSVQCQNESSF